MIAYLLLSTIMLELLLRRLNTFNWCEDSKSELFIFFIQKMEELTFDYSHFYYKPKTNSFPYILNEAYILLQEAIIDNSRTSVALRVVDELVSAIRDSEVLKNILSLDVERLINFLNSKDLTLIEKNLKLLTVEASTNAIASQCMIQIKQILYSHKTKGKNALSNVLDELITALTYSGMSKSFIYYNLKRIFFNGKRKVVLKSSLEEFLKEIFPYMHTFHVCFKIDSPIPEHVENSEHKLGIFLSNEFPKEVFSKYSTKKFEDNSQHMRFITVINIEAYDLFSAHSIALNKVSMLHNVFKLFHHKAAYKISDEAIISQCCRKSYEIIKIERNVAKNILDNKPDVALRKSVEFFQYANIVDDEDAAKFRAALELHGNSIADYKLENQLTSLWTALEAISPSKNNLSNIDNIVSLALPIIKLKYIQAIFDDLYKDLKIWNTGLLQKILDSSGIIDGGKGYKYALLRVLLDNSYDECLDKLFAELGDHELAKNRIYKVVKFIRDRENINVKLSLIGIRVESEIRRIYRARNGIVHKGRSPRNLLRLYEAAHFYFDEVFGYCADMSMRGHRSLLHIFYFSEIHWQQYENFLKSCSDLDLNELCIKILWSDFVGTFNLRQST